ncbi:hypothetical protein GCM10009621_08850 [Corynebacterium felinum]
MNRMRRRLKAISAKKRAKGDQNGWEGSRDEGNGEQSSDVRKSGGGGLWRKMKRIPQALDLQF